MSYIKYRQIKISRDEGQTDEDLHEILERMARGACEGVGEALGDRPYRVHCSEEYAYLTILHTPIEGTQGASV